MLVPMGRSTDERVVRRTVGNWYQRSFGRANIELARAEDPGLRIGDHFVPVSDPPDGARHRKDRREHRRRQAQRAEDDAGIEVDIGIELALDEVVVLEGDALQLHCEVEERIITPAERVQPLVPAPAQYL